MGRYSYPCPQSRRINSFSIREAFNQIDRYQRDSFWAGSGLYEYVQIFVISNGTNTKYYSNTTRWNAIRESTSAAKKKKKVLKLVRVLPEPVVCQMYPPPAIEPYFL